MTEFIKEVEKVMAQPGIKTKVKLSAIDMLLEDRSRSNVWHTQFGLGVDEEASDLLNNLGFKVENW